jgi:peptidoglycan/LPS O-acetylase OafA/YrhL
VFFLSILIGIPVAFMAGRLIGRWAVLCSGVAWLTLFVGVVAPKADLADMTPFWTLNATLILVPWVLASVAGLWARTR